MASALVCSWKAYRILSIRSCSEWALINVRCTQISNHFLDSLHNHSPTWFTPIFKILNYSSYYTINTNLVYNLYSCVHKLPVISPIQCHPSHPKFFEKLRKCHFGYSQSLPLLYSHTASSLSTQFSSFLHQVTRIRESKMYIRDNYALGIDNVDNGPKVHQRCRIQLKG